jgi:hypothetical protein
MTSTRFLLMTALLTTPAMGYGQTNPLPVIVESTTIVPTESGSDAPPLMDVTVRNAGTSTIIAWGVWTEVRFSDGKTQTLGSTVSPELAPNARYTLRVIMPPAKTALAAAVDAASTPTFAVFKDNSAVGDEQNIKMIFRSRAADQRFWELVDSSLRSRRQDAPSATLDALLSDLQTISDKEVLASVMYARVKDELTRSLLGRSREPLAAVVGRLAQEASGGRQAAALHSQRLLR